jgi:MYXO-CTERM domain-containing protein
MACVNRQCITDPAHTLGYCSKGCTADAECAAAPDLECNPASHFCTYRLPPVMLPAIIESGPAARTCSTAGGATPLLGLLALLLRRRRVH